MPSVFAEQVTSIVSRIPEGRVMTYGDIAALVGSPNAARQVGGIAHYGSAELPWHRVVNRFGGLASGYHGGRTVQQHMLEQEYIQVIDFVVKDFERLRWRP